MNTTTTIAQLTGIILNLEEQLQRQAEQSAEAERKYFWNIEDAQRKFDDLQKQLESAYKENDLLTEQNEALSNSKKWADIVFEQLSDEKSPALNVLDKLIQLGAQFFDQSSGQPQSAKLPPLPPQPTPYENYLTEKRIVTHLASSLKSLSQEAVIAIFEKLDGTIDSIPNEILKELLSKENATRMFLDALFSENFFSLPSEIQTSLKKYPPPPYPHTDTELENPPVADKFEVVLPNGMDVFQIKNEANDLGEVAAPKLSELPQSKIKRRLSRTK